MRLWCNCARTCGRVQGDDRVGWVYVGSWRLSPASYHDDPSMPWRTMRMESNLSVPGVTHIRLNCSRGHIIVTDSDALLTAARRGLKNMTLPRVMSDDG